MYQLPYLIVIALAALIILFTLVWLIQLRTRNAAIIDAVWSMSFPLMTAIYFVLIIGYPPRQWMVLGVVCLWGFRLGLYLLFRTLGHAEDVRYTALREEWGDQQDRRMLSFYYKQAVAAVILSIPFILMMINTTPWITAFEIAGAIICVTGVVGESIADQQLKQFKSVAENKGKIMRSGLWAWSRHPNYFFEWLVWVGFFVMSLSSAWGWTSIFGMLLMYYLLTKRTGIGYTEKQMLKSRGEAFVNYQREVSAFFPRPPKIESPVAG